jgi:hypothetical protein
MCGDGTPTSGDVCFHPGASWSSEPAAALAVGDLDGDGHVDVLAGHEVGASVVLGDGAGGLKDSIILPGMQAVLGVAVADHDGHGVEDAILAEQGADRLAVFLADGLGGFAAPALVPTAADPRSVVVGAFDDLPAMDAAVVTEGGASLEVLVNDGTGLLFPDHTVSLGVAPQVLRLGNGDGSPEPDVVVADPAAGAAHLVVRSATWGPPTTFPFVGEPRSAELVDIDDDGIEDLVVACDDGRLRWRRGLGSGDFGVAKARTLGTSLRETLRVDLDGDGAEDLVIADAAAGVLRVVLAAPALELAPATALLAASGVTALAAGDLDEDGVLDVVAGVTGPEGGILVFLGDP